jgi:hypothetical protein
MDRRWQLVVDCLECEEAPFAKGTLVQFRKVLIEQGLDRRLIERTVELAKEKGGFGHRNLRAALDSSPLWGAARVEDTYNLLGHALRKAISVIARQQGRGLTEVANEAGAQIVTGKSLKAALDLDWDNPESRTHALRMVIEALEAVDSWLQPQTKLCNLPQVQESLVVHFPHKVCATCPLRMRCTSSIAGRSVSIHPDEHLLHELRLRQLTAHGRAKLRERVAVEHTLAHIGFWQGERARYRGIRKNLFDLRRTAVVHNLHVIARLPDTGEANHFHTGDPRGEGCNHADASITTL